MSEYQEFTGKSVEEAIKAACDQFSVGLGDLDFEILTPGSRGVLGMGAEPARIVAAPKSALGGTAPKRAAAEATPLPTPRPREDRPFGDRDRGGPGDRDRGPRRDDRGPRNFDRDRGPRRDDRPAGDRPTGERPAGDRPPRPAFDRDRPAGDRPAGDRPAGDRPPRRDDRGPRREDRDDRTERPARGGQELTAAEMAAVTTARGSLAMERAELEAAEATPEALAAGREILETLMGHLGFEGVTVEIREGETSRLNVIGEGADREALGSLIGRKGERLSALQHLVNLMLSRRTGQWTRVLVDVEDYRGRRERQLADLAERAAARVVETGKMLQLEAMPALERRWIHLSLRDNADVSTQSIGEEPNRRVVVVPRNP
jgi:spoIIIJ-associated protein